MTLADPMQPLPQRVALPQGHNKLLLHLCCAPCSGAIIETLLASGIDLTLYFYNPNIHPHDEYQRRKDEVVRFAAKQKVPFVDSDPDADSWMARMRGLEQEPERGRRCTLCFDMRLMKAADHAHAQGFPVVATSLGVSRWKDQRQVNESGQRAVAPYPDLIYWDHNWRKQGGMQRMSAISQREGFYRQDYCGCRYSLLETRVRRERKMMKE